MDLEIQNLTKTLSEYSKTASETADGIANVLLPLAIAVFLTLILLDILDFKKITDQNRIDFSNNIFIEMIVKWVFGAFLLYFIKDILDAFMEVSITITNLINEKYPPTSYSMNNVEGDWGNMVVNAIMNLVFMIINWIVQVIISAIVFIRYIDLYFLKALSPLLVAFYFHDGTRSIVVTFLKTFLATTLLSVALLLITVFYGLIVTDSVIEQLASGNDGEAIMALTRSIIYIMLVAGAGKRIKSLLGVN